MTRTEPERVETRAFLAFLAEHDRRAEHRDRVRRLERQGASEAVVHAEVLTGAMFPSFAATRAAEGGA